MVDILFQDKLYLPHQYPKILNYQVYIINCHISCPCTTVLHAVSPVTAQLGGALGSLSMVLIIIIAALVTYIGYLKCKPSPRVTPDHETVHEDQGRNDSSSSTFSNEVAIHEISSDEESTRN